MKRPGHAATIAGTLGRLEGVANHYGNLGVVYEMRGDLDRSEAMQRKALEIDETLGRLEGMANAYANLGTVHKERGDIEQARELWMKALKLFTQISMKPEAAKVQQSLDELGE